MFNNYLNVLYIIICSIFTTYGQNPICNTDTSLCYSNKKFDSNFAIQLEKKWESTIDVAQRQTPIILDIDNDCVPEIITAGYDNYNRDWIASNQLNVFGTKSKVIKKSFSTFYFNTSTQCFIIVKNNNDFEIIIAAIDVNINPPNVRGKLVCYNSDNTIKWISDQKYGGAIGQGGTLSLADFNKDGKEEIFIHNSIYNAETGTLLTSGGNNGLGGTGFSTISIAADLDDDSSDLELAAGYTVYKININNLNGITGNSMIANNVLINGLGRDGLTTVSDINNDEKLDIIVVTALSFYSGIYVYTYQNSSYEIIAKIDFATYLLFGVLSIGNLTQIGKLDILLTTSNAIKKYSYNNSMLLNEDWSFVVNDGSGFSGLSIFDFDNDGIQEIIYRDEIELKIIDAKNDNPKIIYKTNCVAQTNFDYPVIADIDGTGETKICVTCSENFSDQNGHLTIFGPPPGQKWAPARKIWHQYAYNPLFINDDGNVPQYMHNPATYKNGKYNNFMVQESLIDEDGNYPVPAASLTGAVSCIDYDIATQQYTVDFSINNRADASASAVLNVPVAFYNGNPEAGGSLIGVYRTSSDLAAGNTLSGLSYSFSATDLSSLYMIVNTDKYPIIVSDTSNYDIDECDYTDNLFIAPAPKFTNVNQEICQGDSYPFYGNALTTSGTYYHELADVLGCDSVIARLDLQVSNIKTESLTTSACDTYTWNGQTYTTDGAYTYQTLSVNGCDSITTLNLSVNRSDQINQNIQSCDTYAWNGQNYTQSGIYTYRTQNIHGCDSIVTLDLNVYPSAVVAQSIAACDTYTWNGQTYTQSGSYTYQTQTKNGCDSTITLDLTISNILRTNHPVTACDTYTWNGQTYTTDGAYTYQTLSVNGCDSIATLNLSVNRSDQVNQNIQSCDTYAWNGQTYTQSGVYTYRTQNIHGCDSIVTLDLNVYPSAVVAQSIAACDDYTWNGQTYTQSGSFTYQTQTKNGCDSTITLDLTISNILRTNYPVTACDTYTWNGVTYNADGDYTYSAQSVQGCDSIATLQLVIHPSTTSSLSQTACDAYTWNGQTYDQSGIYTYRTQNTFGCDSVATLSLTVNRASTSSSDINACSQYTWNGQTFTQSGTYDYQTSNIDGCDSIATLRLNIYQPDVVTAQQSACDTYTWNGQTYTQSGTYTYSTQNRYGCDSITNLDLMIHPSEAITLQRTDCDSLVYLRRNLTQSGIYTFDLQNRFGCDSIITLDLTISGDKITSTQSVCNQYTWPINGQTYTSSGSYTEQYTNVAGCDSTYTLDLIIHPDYEVITDAEACAQYLWPVTNQRYTQSGAYTFPLKTAEGCDSILTLDLVIHPEFEFRDTVVATEPYLWSINNKTYENSGIYTETFSTDVSCDSIHYLYLTIKNNTDIFFPNIISPDGANGFFTGYSSNSSVTIASLSVYDRWGNLMFAKENFPANDLQQGWDGQFQGKAVVQGVYTWLAIARLKDGSLETFVGDVTVVR